MSSLFSENSLRISPVPPRINAPVPVFPKTPGRGSIKKWKSERGKGFLDGRQPLPLSAFPGYEGAN